MMFWPPCRSPPTSARLCITPKCWPPMTSGQLIYKSWLLYSQLGHGFLSCWFVSCLFFSHWKLWYVELIFLSIFLGDPWPVWNLVRAGSHSSVLLQHPPANPVPAPLFQGSTCPKATIDVQLFLCLIPSRRLFINSLIKALKTAGSEISIITLFSRLEKFY